MNKKQKNRKHINQSLRNRIINRRYSSTIKYFTKLLKKNIFFIDQIEKNPTNQTVQREVKKGEIITIVSKLTSFLDKAVKKKVLHKNTAGRKKAKMQKLINFKFN